MGEQLSTESAPPEPAAATEPPLPAAEALQQQQQPGQSGKASGPQPEEDAGAPPPAEPQGQETEDGLGGSPEERPGSEDDISDSRRFPLRPVCCTVYCVESDRRPAAPLESPLSPVEEGAETLPTTTPPPSLRRGGRGGGIEVQVGQADIQCPITECSEHLDETTVLFNLPHDDIIKYKYFLELGRIGSSTKPCPQCKHFTTFRKRGHIPTPTKMENKYKIQCPSCQFVWCFKCHSPWHEGVNCKEYKKGDKLLRHWASEIEHGQRNAQKCPKCKIHIQRTEGCDHMTCSQCNTNFCYRCGERYRQLRFFGNHTSNLSIFGCKYRYLPERPHLRRLVRGSVCGGKLLIAPLLLVLGLVMGVIAVIIGLFVFPIYCLCKKKRKRPQTEMPWYE
ncbi:E3 ubiquitin-protein ligase RNF217 isoform X2 [Eublepharis macularius]|uniref:RBR-type E3 ubiquitin transferase n=1 Tax=Eublepharis macularius TaxID=481883 RepID=A0AA97JKR0_EUBMA|nr:E3 ubiquitin-protein ligase RNF217 isoform X2 [Eublepharis macularius]